jgi:transposase
MRAYSTDLRERIVLAVHRGDHSLRQIAHLFAVSVSFVVRLLRRWRRTGTLDPAPHGGGPHRRLDDAALERLRQLVQDHPAATLRELRDLLGIPCHLSTIDRALRRLGITRKKATLHAQERDRPDVQAQRAAFDARLAQVGPEHLLFVDESGANTAMARIYGRAPAGERVRLSEPGQWQTVTLITGMGLRGVVAPFAFVGATDTLAFQTYVTEVLVPVVRPGDVVVWDNLKPHKDKEVIAAVEAAGARVEPLPPWSPDKTPIEELFSKTKGYLRGVAARTVDTVMAALGQALGGVTLKDIRGWFQDRCAYAMR